MTEWINTNYRYDEGGQVQKIKYDPKSFVINRWDNINGDDIIDKKHPHYNELFTDFVLPNILRGVSSDKVNKIQTYIRGLLHD